MRTFPTSSPQGFGRLPGGSATASFVGRVGIDGYSRTLRAALYLGMFMLSWHIFRFGAVNLTFADCAFMVVMLLLLSRARFNILPFGATTPVWCLSLTLMLGGLFISTVANGDPIRWVIVSSQYLFAYLAMPMMLASFDRPQLDRCLVAYVLGVSFSQLCTLIASLVFTFADTSALLGNDFITGTGRIGAFSGNPNTNGAMAAFALLFLLEVMRRRLMPRWCSLVSGMLLLWGLFASASFTSFAVGVIAMSAMMLIRHPGRFLLLGLPVLLGVVAYIDADLPLPGPFQQRVGAAVSSGDVEQAGTFTGRSELVKEAWELSGQTMVLGFGADGYRRHSSYGAPVHFFPLLILTEGGIIAFIGLLGLMAVMWYMAIGAIRSDEALALSVLLVFTGFTFAVPHMYARLWIAPVLVVLVRSYTVPPVQRWTRRTGTWRNIWNPGVVIDATSAAPGTLPDTVEEETSDADKRD